MPLFTSRSIEEFPIGNLPLAGHHRRLREARPGELRIHPHAWIHPADLTLLKDDAATTLLDESGTAIAWLGEHPDAGRAVAGANSFLIVHPWHTLRANELHVASIEEPAIAGEVHPHAVIDGIAQIGEGTRVLPGVYIEGKVIIGRDCKIGPNCYLRGNTSIGDGCHVGQAVEIKNSILLDHTNVGHLGYVGDSVLGSRVNFGAGTTVSNLRHDGAHHRSMVRGKLVDTGRRKFGCIVGDGVHTGINTSIYPGRNLHPGCSTRPGEVVSRDLHPSSP